jgi:hypothetical protein
VSDVTASVLRGPLDLQALPAATPASVRRLLARCLERDPRIADAPDRFCPSVAGRGWRDWAHSACCRANWC